MKYERWLIFLPTCREEPSKNMYWKFLNCVYILQVSLWLPVHLPLRILSMDRYMAIHGLCLRCVLHITGVSVASSVLTMCLHITGVYNVFTYYRCLCCFHCVYNVFTYYRCLCCFQYVYNVFTHYRCVCSFQCVYNQYVKPRPVPCNSTPDDIQSFLCWKTCFQNSAGNLDPLIQVGTFIQYIFVYFVKVVPIMCQLCYCLARKIHVRNKANMTVLKNNNKQLLCFVYWHYFLH